MRSGGERFFLGPISRGNEKPPGKKGGGLGRERLRVAHVVRIFLASGTAFIWISDNKGKDLRMGSPSTYAEKLAGQAGVESGRIWGIPFFCECASYGNSVEPCRAPEWAAETECRV